MTKGYMDWDATAIPSGWAIDNRVTLEDLYQVFKERMIKEVVVIEEVRKFSEFGNSYTVTKKHRLSDES